MAKKLFPAGNPRFGFTHVPRAKQIPYLEGEIAKTRENVKLLEAAVRTGMRDGARLSGDELTEVKHALRAERQGHEMRKAALQKVRVRENRARGK